MFLGVTYDIIGVEKGKDWKRKCLLCSRKFSDSSSFVKMQTRLRQMGSSLSIQTELNQNFLSTMLKTSEIEPMREIWKIVVVFHEKKSYCRTAASECWSSAKLGKNSSNPGSYLLLSGINISLGLKPFRYSRKQSRIPKFVLLFNHQREILKISALEVQRFLSEYEVNKFLEMKVTLNNF